MTGRKFFCEVESDDFIRASWYDHLGVEFDLGGAESVILTEPQAMQFAAHIVHLIHGTPE